MGPYGKVVVAFDTTQGWDLLLFCIGDYRVEHRWGQLILLSLVPITETTQIRAVDKISRVRPYRFKISNGQTTYNQQHVETINGVW